MFCHDKHTFVTTKDVFCRDKHMFVATNTCLSRQKIILVEAPANDRSVMWNESGVWLEAEMSGRAAWAMC